MINGFVDSAGYTIPVDVVTYTKAGGILKTINQLLTAAFVSEALYSAAIGGVPEQSIHWEEKAMGMLKLIQKGTMSLVDAPKETDGIVLPNDREPDGEFNLDAEGTERASVFKRDSIW